MRTSLNTDAAEPVVVVRQERGQGTAEYALLLLAAATIALIVLTWATGTGRIGALFDAVIDSVIGRV